MSNQYELLAINEFRGVEFKSVFDEQIVEQLKPPTRLGADWYGEMAPPYYHYRNFKGVFDNGPMQAAYRADYLFRANGDELVKGDESVRNQYTWLDENGIPRLITEDPNVLKIIKKIVKPLPGISKWIRRRTDVKAYTNFADDLDAFSELLPAGEFDEAMVRFLNQSPDSDIRWMALPVEYRGDPMGDKVFPQALLAYLDRPMTNKANADLDRYNRSAEERFGERPLQPWILVANAVVLAGDLALSNSPKSGFHIPNDPETARKLGHSLIYTYPNSIARLNELTLSPGLVEVAGVQSSSEDAHEYTKIHEIGHGYHGLSEDRLGQWRTAVREGWAATLAVVLTDHREFSQAELAGVIRGMLAFAMEDSRPFRQQLFEPYGQNQPDVRLLNANSGYSVDGYLVARKAITRQAIRRQTEHGEDPHIDIPKIVEIAKEHERLYREIAENGDENSAVEKIGKAMEEKRFHPVVKVETEPGPYQPPGRPSLRIAPANP